MRTFVLRAGPDGHVRPAVAADAVVAEGVAFADGVSVVHWLTAEGSTVVWQTAESAMHVHTVYGNWVWEWKDESSTSSTGC